MPLIEEKLGIGLPGVYPDKRCVRYEKCFTPRRNKTETFATALGNLAGRYRK
jgi:hypothetical protein